MNIYKCNRGDICLTGDSYGMDICLVLGQKYDDNFGFDVVIFANVITGRVHYSGHKDNSAYADDCHFVSKVDEKEVVNFMNKWCINENNLQPQA